MGRKPTLSVAEIESLQRKGWTLTAIANLMGVTRQAVSAILINHGKRTQKPRLRHFPFEVPTALQQAPYQRLRDYAEWMETEGKGMSDGKLKRVRSWYSKLEKNNWVVEFDPNLPPEPKVSASGGWAYRPRKKSDGELIIRVNEWTSLSDEGRRLYSRPEFDIP